MVGRRGSRRHRPRLHFLGHQLDDERAQLRRQSERRGDLQQRRSPGLSATARPVRASGQWSDERCRARRLEAPRARGVRELRGPGHPRRRSRLSRERSAAPHGDVPHPTAASGRQMGSRARARDAQGAGPADRADRGHDPSRREAAISWRAHSRRVELRHARPSLRGCAPSRASSARSPGSPFRRPSSRPRRRPTMPRSRRITTRTNRST